MKITVEITVDKLFHVDDRQYTGQEFAEYLKNYLEWLNYIQSVKILEIQE